MIDFADKADFVVDPGYYRGRWGYFSAAADFMRSIPGVQPPKCDATGSQFRRPPGPNSVFIRSPCMIA
jgi:hypothetical protein